MGDLRAETLVDTMADKESKAVAWLLDDTLGDMEGEALVERLADAQAEAKAGNLATHRAMWKLRRC